MTRLLVELFSDFKDRNGSNLFPEGLPLPFQTLYYSKFDNQEVQKFQLCPETIPLPDGVQFFKRPKG